MRPLVTPEQMARADRAAIEAGTPAEVLMERAGAAVARAAVELAGGRYGRRAVIVCGKGSNGGDGFVAARRLARDGLNVICLNVGGDAGGRGAARHHRESFEATGGRVEPFDEARLGGADVVVDAIFGTGFRGRAEGDAAAAIEALNRSPAPALAVDIPSGVDGRTGSVEGPAVRAALTVVMAAEKLGTALGAGAAHAGGIRVVDIGIAPPRSDVAMVEGADVAAALPMRPPDAHKRTGGAVAVLAGSTGMSGAALLACRGAVRMGAGYATLGCTPGVDVAKAAVLPEVLSRIVSAGETLGADAIGRFEDVLQRADALALGPGLGRGDAQRALVERALDEVALPLVLDADGLNVLERHADALEKRRAPLVLTPHPAELARLTGATTGEIQADRVRAARAAAERFAAVVLLKGWRTLVAAPGGRVVVNPTGGPALATAGTGDVLTGAVAALLAAGVDAYASAWAAAYVHGRAGDLVGGPAGVVAWDVAERLPQALREVRAEPVTPLRSTVGA